MHAQRAGHAGAGGPDRGQRHLLFDALKRGEGTRAQALATEHTEVAQMNMRLALERRAQAEQVMPAIRLVVG